MDETAAIRAMLARLSAVHVETDPWPHAFVADFLPDPLYRDLVAALPATPRTSGPPRGWASPPTPYVPSGVGLSSYRSADERLVTNIPDPAWWGEDLADILATLAVTFHNREVLAALMRIFRAEQRDVIERALRPEVQIQSAVRLMHDADDYDLLVHTDSPDKFLSIVVYVPRDGGTEGGTSLFRLKAVGEVSGYKYYPTRYFDLARKLLFTPNAAFVLLRTEESFHGKPRMHEDVRADRMTLQVNYFLMRRVEGQLVPDLPAKYARAR